MGSTLASVSTATSVHSSNRPGGKSMSPGLLTWPKRTSSRRVNGARRPRRWKTRARGSTRTKVPGRLMHLAQAAHRFAPWWGSRDCPTTYWRPYRRIGTSGVVDNRTGHKTSVENQLVATLECGHRRVADHLAALRDEHVHGVTNLKRRHTLTLRHKAVSGLLLDKNPIAPDRSHPCRLHPLQRFPQIGLEPVLRRPHQSPPSWPPILASPSG